MSRRQLMGACASPRCSSGSDASGVYTRTLAQAVVRRVGPPRSLATYSSSIVIPLLLALALAPWTHPLSFRPLAGWQTGASGNTGSAYVGPRPHATVPLESAAWIARNVRYRDEATADPPNKTLGHLPARGI